MILSSPARAQTSDSWVKIVEAARPAVVVIETDKKLGSGFFVKSDGTLLTNNHVIAGASEISVKLSTGEVYHRAYVLGSDEDKDIAVLRIEAADVPTIPLGNSNDCKVGEDVILLGAPSGLAETVSNGLISNIGLTGAGLRVIQTTAPASPGSSGGPLLDSRGIAVGILSFSVVEGQNLNFAIPINYARGILDSLALARSPAKELLGSPSSPKSVLAAPTAQKHPGVLVSGYGMPASSFQAIFLELLNFLASHGIEIANQPSEFHPVTGDAASLNYLLGYLPKMGAESLLYVKVEHGWSNIHRLDVQCFDAKGQMLWEEKASSAHSWATTESGAAKAVVEQMEKKLIPRIGQPGLPIKKVAASQNPADKGP
jgi:S1-C subfamily serine protease